MLLEFEESGHPTFRAATPLSRGQLKSKGRGKLSIHFTADQDTIETIFRIILSVNQLSVYGAVAAICEEIENHQDGSVEPEILMGQSIVLGEIKAEILLQNENSLNHQILWQQNMERIESLSPESKVSRFCMEAGFVRVVWDSISRPRTLVILDNFVQRLVVQTLFLETIQLHNQKDGFKET